MPTPPDRLRLAVFASGGGSNLQALLDAVEAGTLPLDVALVVSNRAEAGALARAERRGLPTAVLNDPNDGEALLDLLRTHEVTLVALAGYMRKIPETVVRAFRHRMLNIHPALLPAFGGRGYYGKRVHQAVLDYGAQWTGATVHLVDEDYDTGPVVLQQPVPVQPDDTADTLAARVLATEHTLYPQALRYFAEHRVRIDGRRVRLLAPPSPDLATET